LGQDELDTRLGLIKDLESRLWQHLAEVEGRMRAALHRRNSDASVANATAYQVAHEESELLQQTLSEANQIRDCWQRRFQLSKGNVSASEIAQWREEAEQARQRLSHVSEKLRLRLTQRQALLASLGRSQFPVADPTPQSDSFPADEAKTNLDVAAQVEELERIVAVYQSIQLLIVSGERMYDRFIEDLKSRESQFSLAEWGHLAADGIATVWEYELTTIDDEPITVRKIVFGCLLLLCGYFISRTLASIVAHRVLPKFGLSEAGASVFRTVLFYLLLAVLTFVTLDIVSVPMTVFTFLGGAVAIGLGFGSQNLINNFISGLILLVERPIRIGDLVNVDGIDANVTNIGARSTRVRTGANLEILVPNSKFLENNVTNWTLSDTRVRTSVSVGVAYGSPVRQVIATLRKVIGEHPQIIQTPEPIVLFQDFADSALTFEVHFWVHMKRMMDGARIRSEVRVAIDEAFMDAGIVIAFPQRDVHIDMQSPIEVSLASPRGLVAPESLVSKAYSREAA
jgi:small-conductance mechanosensitive channel